MCFDFGLQHYFEAVRALPVAFQVDQLDVLNEFSQLWWFVWAFTLSLFNEVLIFVCLILGTIASVITWKNLTAFFAFNFGCLKSKFCLVFS